MEPIPGETAAEYLKRCLAAINDKTPFTEPVTASITYQINGVDTDPMSVTFTPCDFNSYKEITKEERTISITFDAVPLDDKFIRHTWNAAHLVESKPEYHCTKLAKDHKYRKKTYTPELKRSMR
jgi:hypothetical protein